MQPGIYDFGICKRGDTLPAVAFTLNRNVSGTITPISITDCVITCMFKKENSDVSELTCTTEGDTPTILITDGAAGEFEFAEGIELDLDEDTKYFYDIQFVFLTGAVKTYIEGTIYIVKDITHE